MMHPIREDELAARDLLYKAIKKHLDTVGKQIDASNREIIWQTLVQQLSQNEDILAKKSIQALKEIDVKLQREITNFINLKMRLAVAKAGIDLSFMQKGEQDEFMDSHTVLFEDLEHRMIAHLDKVEKAKLKVTSKDAFLTSVKSGGTRSRTGSPASGKFPR